MARYVSMVSRTCPVVGATVYMPHCECQSLCLCFWVISSGIQYVNAFPAEAGWRNVRIIGVIHVQIKINEEKSP